MKAALQASVAHLEPMRSASPAAAAQQKKSYYSQQTKEDNTLGRGPGIRPT